MLKNVVAQGVVQAIERYPRREQGYPIQDNRKQFGPVKWQKSILQEAGYPLEAGKFSQAQAAFPVQEENTRERNARRRTHGRPLVPRRAIHPKCVFQVPQDDLVFPQYHRLVIPGERSCQGRLTRTGLPEKGVAFTIYDHARSVHGQIALFSQPIHDHEHVEVLQGMPQKPVARHKLTIKLSLGVILGNVYDSPIPALFSGEYQVVLPGLLQTPNVRLADIRNG